LCLLAGARRGIASTRLRQFHARAAGFRKGDGNGLFRIGRAVLSFANVVHLFADEFAGLGAGRFAFLFVSLGSFNYFLLWHVTLLDKFEMSSCSNLLSGL
jgi:hypothetical protein